jgi:hypothetical protein
MRSIVIGVLVGGLGIGGVTGACVSSTAPADSATTNPAASSASASAPDGGAIRASAEKTSKPGGATEAIAWREVTIPAGTTLALILDTAVGSDTSRAEELVQGHLAHAIVVDGVTAVSEDSIVTGIVTDATRAGKTNGRAHLALRFSTLVPRGQDERYQLTTNAVGRTAPSEKKKDAAKIAVPAAGGAVIGALVGGKKGAVIGGAVGGGAGAAVVLSDRGQEVRMARGAAMSLTLTEPLTVRTRG